MVAVEQLVTDHLDLWTAAIKRRSAAGRGSSTKIELFGIKKLRELILELAVRGLLVPQDLSDEPAIELLMKVATKKAKLVKEGEIKKDKPLPPIGDEEKPFDLPAGWEWSRLQNISEYIQRGKGPVYADSGQVRVISQKCVQWAGFDLSAARFVDDASLSGYKEERFLKNQDLLWNSTGTGTVGRVNVIEQVLEDTLVADSHVTIVRTLDVQAKYICAYISAPGVQSRIEPTHEASLVSGSTQQVELNTSAVVLLPVPVPPLNEQHRIVAKVNELMALCDQLEAQTQASIGAHQTLVETLLSVLTGTDDQAQFATAWQRIAEHFDTLFTTEESIDQLKQTVLQLSVMGKLVRQDPNDEPAGQLLKRVAAEKAKFVKESGKNKDSLLPKINDGDAPFDLPTGWEWARLGTIASLRGGFAYQSGYFLTAGEHQVIRMGNVRPDCLRLEENPVYISTQNADATKDYEILDGDILLTMTGTKGKNDYLYSVLISKANTDGRKLYLNQRLCSVRLPLFSKNFANIALKDSRLLNTIYRTSTGSANQANVGMGAISNWLIPVPPIDEQHRIVAKVDELMALCSQLKTRLNEARTTQVHLADAMTEQALAV